MDMFVRGVWCCVDERRERRVRELVSLLCLFSSSSFSHPPSLLLLSSSVEDNPVLAMTDCYDTSSLIAFLSLSFSFFFNLFFVSLPVVVVVALFSLGSHLAVCEQLYFESLLLEALCSLFQLTLESVDCLLLLSNFLARNIWKNKEREKKKFSLW